MQEIKLQIKRINSDYSIFIGQSIIPSIWDMFDLQNYSSVFIITESNVGPIYLSELKHQIRKVYSNIDINEYTFEAGEKNKNIDTVQKILRKLAEVHFDRKGLIINLGGGVTTDIGGFVASIYQRGVKFINISTTLEGMVDASVGGKVGVNLDGWKNYIGVFNQPSSVIIDVDTLDTLGEREFVQGFGEVLKHGLIFDSKYFDMATAKKVNQYTKSDLVEIIKRSCEIKAKIVEEDEKENGIRKILNFGHTVGHAIETLSFNTTKPLFHGEAVAIGMIAEAKISNLIGNISNEEFDQIEKGIESSGLPIRICGMNYDQIKEIMIGDKKNEKGKIKWVLLNSIGEADWNIEVDEKFYQEAISYILN